MSFPSSALDMLHRLGLKHAELKKGVISLRTPHTVCEIGDTLTPEQCRILVGFLLIDFPLYWLTNIFYCKKEIVAHSIG